jgi:hypothetical protein
VHIEPSQQVGFKPLSLPPPPPGTHGPAPGGAWRCWVETQTLKQWPLGGAGGSWGGDTDLTCPTINTYLVLTSLSLPYIAPTRQTRIRASLGAAVHSRSKRQLHARLRVGTQHPRAPCRIWPAAARLLPPLAPGCRRPDASLRVMRARHACHACQLARNACAACVSCVSACASCVRGPSLGAARRLGQLAMAAAAGHAGIAVAVRLQLRGLFIRRRPYSLRHVRQQLVLLDVICD